ncbi:hypothetical protein ARALYDRAFT_920377 [Arabidopsis lyrata subsp. lyrata]|uniref:Uncharacterized protein n=1 Tax=Arabidopsis lyrata subsp. lyrata TaxID=81972 RepID=D7MWY1_ARALL|nr:hypothetical protein ARALYDRAFT_920377 [Arabidopsis lyrata subsp. lyrata]
MVPGNSHLSSSTCFTFAEINHDRTTKLSKRDLVYPKRNPPHQAKAYGELLLRDTISSTGTAMFLWFSSPASHPDQTRQTLPLPSPEMHVLLQNLSPSPYSGRRTQDLLLPVKKKLGQLVDFFISGP